MLGGPTFLPHGPEAVKCGAARAHRVSAATERLPAHASLRTLDDESNRAASDHSGRARDPVRSATGLQSQDERSMTAEQPENVEAEQEAKPEEKKSAGLTEAEMRANVIRLAFGE